MTDFAQIAAKFELAQRHYARGQLDEALALYDEILAAKPDLEEALCNRGAVLDRLGRAQEALASLDRAIAINPALAEAHNNRGQMLQLLDRWEEALAAFGRAVALKPDFAEAYNNRGFVLLELGRRAEARQDYDRAVALDPGHVTAQWNVALLALLEGRLEEGWRRYEWRRKRAGAGQVYPPLAGRLWLGREDIAGKTLLIHPEQGLGDTIQFCRYAPMALARGAKVVLCVQDPLVRLIHSLDAARDNRLAVIGGCTPLPPFDFYAPMLSLPLAFGTTLQTVPSATPYLHAEPERVRLWKSRIGAHGFKVGIAWQGNPKAQVDPGRSLSLRWFETLAHIPGVRLISLQKNEGAEQLSALPPGMKVENPGDDFDAGGHAFLDTAAVMEVLDLVISSDTATAHLAGALGRPVWVALKSAPDWRWLQDRADSPWYPTMRLFRQPSRGDWQSVFHAMAAELPAMVARASFPAQ
jgi:Tfp pilus assembly protein PilF